MVEDGAGPPQHYMNQEGVYVHRLTSKMVDDSVRTDLHPVGQVDEMYLSDDEWAETNDDENAELVLSFAHDEYDEKLVKERTEWQVMLANVLTGEVFQAEKSRLQVQGRDSKPTLLLWTELKAKVACRSLSEQRRVLAVGRGYTHEVLDKIINFKPLPPPVTISHAYSEIGQLLSLLDRCESLWPNLKAMREYFPMYGSEELQKRSDALTAWYTVVQSVYQEHELLKKWTGNEDADPTIPLPVQLPSVVAQSYHSDEMSNVEIQQTASPPSLVQIALKQEGALKSIFEQHIERYLFPLVARARQCMRQYDSEFSKLNLPDIGEILGPLVDFSIKLIQQSMELRLVAAAKMYNPNTVMIDEAVTKFETYLSLGLKLAQNCIQLGMSMQKISLNETMLKSIRFYLDLLSNKFLDGGSSSMSFFRSFKNIEQLDGHFNFLQVTCQLIEGGDVSVAEQFSSLHLRILSRLLAYWEHQMGGPRRQRKMDIDRWFVDTCENIRGIHRKLMRFYKTLCNTYENTSEFILRPQMGTRMQDIINMLHDLGYALVLPGGEFEWAGTYAFASRSLRSQPLVVKSLLQGHSRPPLEHEEPGAIILITVNEPLNWIGPVQQLASGAPLLHFQGQVRLVAQGGYPELQYFQKLQPKLFDELLLRTVLRKSQLSKVEMELHRMRALWLKLMLTVLQSAIRFRRKIRTSRQDCMETVQVMMAFAHDFGERSLRLVPEVNRGKVVLKMFEFCLEWLDFVVDDCPPGDSKKFKWTVTALEFAMKMTRGVNVLALPEDQFSRLRGKVADCMAILIAHYDIMGARSKAANLTNHNNRVRLQQQAQIRGASAAFQTPPHSGVPSTGAGGSTNASNNNSTTGTPQPHTSGTNGVQPGSMDSDSNVYPPQNQHPDLQLDAQQIVVNAPLPLVTPASGNTPHYLIPNSSDRLQLGNASSSTPAVGTTGTPVSPANSMSVFNGGNNSLGGAAAALKDDDEVIAAHRVTALEKFEQLDTRMTSPATHGKILDQHNTEFEFLSFASSPFTAAAMRWQRAEPIGSGSFGSVFKANSLDDFQVMAVKEVRISLTQSISKVLKSIKDEMNVLEMVSHPNIVQYYGVEVHRERVYIFMEYCPEGSLAEMLQYGRIDDELIVQFFSLQILEGLAYLHDIGIVHRDIKPANILLKNNFIKIVDFGAAKIIANNGNLAAQTQADSTKGTPMYMAPEVINREPSASLPSVDIWSLGCVMLQMITGQLPWSDCDNIYSILYCIGNNRMPTIPDDETIDPDCRTLLVSCLQRNPSLRLSAMDLLRDPWFDSAREALNQFLEMRDHEIDSLDPSSTTNSGSNVSLASQQTTISNQELIQQQQVSKLEHQPHEVLYAPELVSGYDQHGSSSDMLPQVTPMEPIVESDMEYEEQR